MPKPKLHFSGSTPPEIFVGRVNYPNVFSGVLSPQDKISNSQLLSSPELWVKQKLSIEQILELRGQLIYGRKESNIKSNKSLNNAMQELALSSKPVSTEFFLEKFPRLDFSASKAFSIMANPAPISRIILEENPHVEKKVDSITQDYDVKSIDALTELYKSNIQTSHLQKLFSAGLLGVKIQRKLVPTRWAITAVDDILSKKLLEKIKLYPELTEILIFSSNYNGNHYNFLVLPDSFSFEVIEAEMPGNVWNPSTNLSFSQDYEQFHGRKTYASNVTGAYYANLLGVAEYLEKIKKQASVLVLREIREDYYAPLGVGILREITREAFTNQPIKAKTIDEAFELMQKNFKININEYRKILKIITNYKKQKKVCDYF